MATDEKEEQIKNNLEVIKDHVPKLIEEAESLNFKEIVKNAKSLEKYVEKLVINIVRQKITLTI